MNFVKFYRTMFSLFSHIRQDINTFKERKMGLAVKSYLSAIFCDKPFDCRLTTDLFLYQADVNFLIWV